MSPLNLAMSYFRVKGNLAFVSEISQEAKETTNYIYDAICNPILK